MSGSALHALPVPNLDRFLPSRSNLSRSGYISQSPHGEIAFEPHREKLIREALKAAGGRWEKDSEEYQLVLTISPNLRGAGYCLKSYSKARPERRRNMQRYGSPRSMVAAFEGKAVTASVDLKRAAIKCHSAAVAEVIHFRGSMAASELRREKARDASSTRPS